MKHSFIYLLLFCSLLSISESLKGTCLKKEFLYEKYTLSDKYLYNKTERLFQWEKIDSLITRLDTFQHQFIIMATLQNYKNRNGTAPLVVPNTKNKYGNVSDTFGVERSQSIPLYSVDSLRVLTRYGRDGALAAITGDTLDFYKVTFMTIPGEWMVPKKYVHVIGPVIFNKVIFVDRTNQNITTLDKADSCWHIRSMNPATTGFNRPPYQKPTPKGVFVIQSKLPRMVYYKDGTSIIGGYAPYASRFCCGGYIHGVPVNLPTTAMVEYSPTLGTTPRSHMCVRNVTSHALFIYNWADVLNTLVIVID